jgi:MFS family permease
MNQPVPTTCYRHPSVETSLRCNRCDKPICPKCAIKSPVGYRCPDCVRTQQKVFDTAVWSDYLIVFFLGGFFSFLGGLAVMLITSIIWGFFILFIAPAIGVFIGNLMRRIVRRHSRNLNYTFATALILGPLPFFVFLGLGGLLVALFGGNFDLMSAFALFGPLIWQIVYLVMAVPAAYAQFSGLQFFKS